MRSMVILLRYREAILVVGFAHPVDEVQDIDVSGTGSAGT